MKRRLDEDGEGDEDSGVPPAKRAAAEAEGGSDVPAEVAPLERVDSAEHAGDVVPSAPIPAAPEAAAPEATPYEADGAAAGGGGMPSGVEDTTPAAVDATGSAAGGQGGAGFKNLRVEDALEYLDKVCAQGGQREGAKWVQGFNPRHVHVPCRSSASSCTNQTSTTTSWRS